MVLSLSQKHGHRIKRNRVSPVERPEVEFSGRVARRVANTVQSEFAQLDMGNGRVQLVSMVPVQVGAGGVSCFKGPATKLVPCTYNGNGALAKLGPYK